MIDSLFGQRTFAILKNGLDSDVQRHDLIANNIANVNTPGFKRSDVVFGDRLAQALEGGNFKGRQTRPQHIQIGLKNPEDVRASIITDIHTEMRNDENNVDIDKEMAELAKTQLHYRTLVQGMSGEAGKIANAIRNGRSA